MRLEVRSRIHGEKLNRSIVEAGLKLFQKLESSLPEVTMVTVDLESLTSHKKGRTHYVHVTLSIPGEPRTFHAEALAEDFRSGLDKCFARTQKFVRHWHGKSIKLTRRRDRQAKAGVNHWLHAKLSKPHRFFGKFRKHDPEIPAE